MNPLVIVIIVVLFGGSFAYIILMQRKQKQTTKKYESPSMIAKSEEFQEELLTKLLEDIAPLFPDEKIIAFTECAYISNLADQAKNTLITGLKVVGWGALGIKAKYQQVEHAAYLILTDNNLHYILFEEGEHTDGVSLTSEQLSKAKIEDLTSTDQVSKMFATMGDKESKKLVIEENGSSFAIIFFDRITKSTYGAPVADYTTGIKDVLGKGRVMGIRFKEKLKEQYPNLKY